MDATYSPGNILIVAVRFETELANIIGESQWQKIHPSFSTIMEGLAENQDNDKRFDLALRLVELLEQYANAILLFDHELKRVEQARTALRSLVLKMGVTENHCEEYITSLLVSVSEYVRFDYQSNRIIFKDEGSLGKAESVKISNFKLQPLELAKLILGTIPLAYELNPLLLGTGILLTFITLKEASTIKFSERESCVFWGIIKAKDINNFADETAIFDCTNNERGGIGLSPLSTSEMKDAINQLEKMKCIEMLGGRWRLSERYFVKKQT